MGLCRLCGIGEREHYGSNFHHPFIAGGREGHDMSRNPQWYDGQPDSLRFDASKPNQSNGPKALDPASSFSKVIEVQKGAPPKSNPKFHAALKKMAEVHDKKSLDYANTVEDKYYTNFEEAAQTAGVSVEEVFLTLIGVKLARLRELKRKGLTPQNESVQDSRLDLANYAVLMYSYFID